MKTQHKDFKRCRDDNRQPYRISSINRKDKWTIKELNILARKDLSDYEKVKLLPNRKDGSVRMKRRRMGFSSKMIEFKREFDSFGYKFIRKNNKYIAEHRYIAETMLGRKLRTGEIVHHINGDKKDNRPENLIICSSRNEHNTIHWQAFEIINQLMKKNIIKFNKKTKQYILC